MKIKSGFVLRKIASSWMVVPVGERAAEVNGMISLNETAAFVWQFLQEDHTKEEAVEAMVAEFDVTPERAAQDIDVMLSNMKAAGLLDD